MYWATADNRIGKSSALPDGGVEIPQERYKELVEAMANRQLVTVVDGEAVVYSRPVYAPDGTEREERDPDEPLITEAPPEELHVPKWEDGEWVEAETDAQREVREAEELENARSDALRRAHAGHSDSLSDLHTRYPQTEREGWHELVEDAKAKEGECIEDYAAELGVSISDAADRVLAAREGYRKGYGKATGKLTRLRDKIDSAETVEELQGIDW